MQNLEVVIEEYLGCWGNNNIVTWYEFGGKVKAVFETNQNFVVGAYGWIDCNDEYGGLMHAFVTRP